jgi:hypothetical protein
MCGKGDFGCRVGWLDKQCFFFVIDGWDERCPAVSFDFDLFLSVCLGDR